MQHDAHFLGEAARHFDKVAASVNNALAQHRLTVVRGVAREAVAHLQRRRQIRRTTLEHLGEVLAGVPGAGEEQGDPPSTLDGDDPGGKYAGALLIGILGERRRALLAGELEDLHGGIVVVY